MAASTIILTVLVAIPLGTLAAYKAGSWIDKFVMVFSVAGFSIPVFVLGYILVYFFAIRGSSVSRNPSPTMLTDITVIPKATPGKNIIHGHS